MMAWRRANNARAMREAHLGDYPADLVLPPMRPIPRRQYRPPRWIENGVQAFLGWLGAAVYFAMVIAWAIGALILLPSKPAASHEFYPPLCCNERDCGPLASHRVIPMTSGGYLVDGQILVKRENVQPSPDARYHGCFGMGMFFAQLPLLRCFFAPIGTQ